MENSETIQEKAEKEVFPGKSQKPLPKEGCSI